MKRVVLSTEGGAEIPSSSSGSVRGSESMLHSQDEIKEIQPAGGLGGANLILVRTV